MKKVLAIALVLGMVSVANAGTLRANFVGGGNTFTGTEAQVEIWYDQAGAELNSAVQTGFEGIAGDPLSITAVAPGDGTSQNVLGPLGLSSTVGTFWAGGTEPTGLSLLVGTATITATDLTPATYEIVFDHATVVINDAGGVAAAFAPGFGADYAGYYAYGDYAGPEVSNKTGVISPRNPLFFTVPEPAGLALLAIGGIAVLRRR